MPIERTKKKIRPIRTIQVPLFTCRRRRPFEVLLTQKKNEAKQCDRYSASVCVLKKGAANERKTKIDTFSIFGFFFFGKPSEKSEVLLGGRRRVFSALWRKESNWCVDPALNGGEIGPFRDVWARSLIVAVFKKAVLCCLWFLSTFFFGDELCWTALNGEKLARHLARGESADGILLTRFSSKKMWKFRGKLNFVDFY